MKTSTKFRKWNGWWRASWPKHASVAAGLSALLLQSCKCTDRLTRSTVVQEDSLSVVKVETVSYTTIPEATTTLTLTPELIEELTQSSRGIGLHSREGRVSVDVRADGAGGLEVTAHSDSTGQRVERTEEERAHRIRADTTGTTSTVQTAPAGGTLRHGFGIGLGLTAGTIVLGVILYILFKTKGV